MTSLMAIGRANERAAITLFAIVFLVSLVKALIHIRRREFALHREGMLRAFAIGLVVATIRPIVGVFLAFPAPLASGVLRHRILDRLSAAFDNCGDLDQLHAT